MSWISEVGLPFNTANINTGNIYATGNITADGSITAGNSFYVNGTQNNRYYLSNSGTNDDAIFSYSAGGGYFYSLIDIHDQLQIRAVDTNGNASVPFVIQNNQLAGSNNVGGLVIFDCVGSSAGVPVQVRPILANYNIMTNPIPEPNALITYYDYQNIQTTKNIGSVVTSTSLSTTTYLTTSGTDQQVGSITLGVGLWNLNISFGFQTQNNNVIGFTLYYKGLPHPPFPTGNSLYIYNLDARDSGQDLQDQSFWSNHSVDVYLTTTTTITLWMGGALNGGAVPGGTSILFNPASSTTAVPTPYLQAMKIG